MMGNVKRPRVSGSEEFAAVVRKVARSEESMTRMTPYRLPYHDNRFFAVALNDALPLSSPRQQILRWRSHEDA